MKIAGVGWAPKQFMALMEEGKNNRASVSFILNI
jgi:hypothetical protein